MSMQITSSPPLPGFGGGGVFLLGGRAPRATCDLTAGCVGRTLAPPWTCRTPAEEGCPGFVLRRPEGFAPMGFGAGFLWAPGIFRVFFICSLNSASFCLAAWLPWGLT